MPREGINQAPIDFDRITFVTATDETVSDLTGHGRILDGWLSRSGKLLGDLLSKTAQGLGAGPTSVLIDMLVLGADGPQLADNCARCYSSLSAARARLLQSRSSTSFKGILDYLTAFRCLHCRQQFMEIRMSDIRFIEGCEKLVRYIRDRNISARALALCYLLLLLYFDADIRPLLTTFNTATILHELQEESVLWDASEKMAIAPNVRRALLCMTDTSLLGTLRSFASLDNLPLEEYDLALQNCNLRLPLAYWTICGLKQLRYDVFFPSAASVTAVWAHFVASGDPLSCHVLGGFLDKLYFSLYNLETDEAVAVAWTRLWLPMSDARTLCAQCIRDLPNSFLSGIHAVYMAHRSRLLEWNMSTNEQLEQLSQDFSEIGLHPNSDHSGRLYDHVRAKYQLEWRDWISTAIRRTIPEKERKRQVAIYELIQFEMVCADDLEAMKMIYVNPLRTLAPPVISHDRLEDFIHHVFGDYTGLLSRHKQLFDNLRQTQMEQQYIISSIVGPLSDAFLNFRDVYMRYGTMCSVAAYRIEEETNNNTTFKTFLAGCLHHPMARGLDVRALLREPLLRLPKYEVMLKDILENTPEDHKDRAAIPELLGIIKTVRENVDREATSAEEKFKLRRYNTHFVFKPGSAVFALDLLHEGRSLIHVGRLLLDGRGAWSELLVLLFDHYLVLTKPREKNGVMKYQVTRPPIPLDLLTIYSFNDPPTQPQRFAGLLRKLRGGEKATPQRAPNHAGESRAIYPCMIHQKGRMGGLHILYAESSQIRTEWQEKLNHALALRKAVQQCNKTFEIETLSAETFLVPSMQLGRAPAWNHDTTFTGKVTCSAPFMMADGRAIMVIGCATGVWIGFGHDARLLCRVLRLKMVTQCAMLKDFGILLVLADKSLYAYDIDALVPSSMQNLHSSQTPQKLNGTKDKDVHFFSVGNMNGRTLVIYKTKKGLDSVFRVLEPVIGKIDDRARDPASLDSRLELRTQHSEWFRVYTDFFLPSDSFDLIFLKAKIAILCTKGFVIMDLIDFKSETFPQLDDPRFDKLAKRCESCKPLGMFRSMEDEFLLCYNEFGLYIDKHGDPSRQGVTVEWEGTAERVAWHPPYVLLFDSRFIEVRHVENGRLVQIIPGNDVRCIWNGGRAPSALTPGPTQEDRVHVVMNAPEPVPGSDGDLMIAQHVFELVPISPIVADVQQ